MSVHLLQYRGFEIAQENGTYRIIAHKDIPNIPYKLFNSFDEVKKEIDLIAFDLSVNLKELMKIVKRNTN